MEDAIKELLSKMYHISGVKETDDAVELINVHIKQLEARIAKLSIENSNLYAENAQLRAALEAVEWKPVDEPYCSATCPWCGACEHRGHWPDCQRQVALGLVKP